MFAINILETISMATTVMVGILFVFCCNDMFNQLDKSFIKLKRERDQMEAKIYSLEKEMEQLKNISDASNETNTLVAVASLNGKPTSCEINNILINENRKLHVRCDMLEEELLKTREQNDKNTNQGITHYSSN
jgi:hemerythrin-like domain-containing protein